MDEKQPNNENLNTKAKPAETTGSTGNKKTGKVALLAVLILIVGALGWAFYEQQQTDVADSETAAGMPDFSSVPDTVARVNGVAITKEDYIEAYQQSAQMAVQQGLDINDEAVQSSIATQVLDVLVNTELLAQAASAAGLSVDEGAVDSEIESLTTQMGGEEAFESALASSGMSLTQLEDSMAEQILIESYLESTPELSSEISISEEDLRARYDEAATLSPDSLPPFEEVVDVIRMQLEAEAQDSAIGTVLERLKAEAEVEVVFDPAN